MEVFMSCSVIHNNIRTVLEETNTAYSTVVDSSGAPNMDYAGYCCHAFLNRFRQSLDNPDLSAERLESLLRRAARKYASDSPETNWTYVMARYISRHANAN
jgi:hypothetical protein